MPVCSLATVRPWLRGFGVVLAFVSLAACGLSPSSDSSTAARQQGAGATPRAAGDDPQVDGESRGLPAANAGTCVDPIPLPMGSGTIYATNNGAHDNGTGHGGDCRNVSANSPDRVYTFVLDKPGKIDFRMSGYTFDPVLHLRTDCLEAATEVACNDTDMGTGSGLAMELPAGRYFLFADSRDGHGGDYTLRSIVLYNPCAGNPCGEAAVCDPLDGATYTCDCGPGQTFSKGSCIANPCDASACSDGPKTRCVPQQDGSATCECALGTVSSAGDCIEDASIADWTFMVYLNADNNLENDGLGDLAEMEAVGSSARVNVVVLLDTRTYYNGTTRKLLVKKKDSNVLADLGDLDLGDPQVLARFGMWGARAFPAHHYALVMWDHGNGWNKRSLLETSDDEDGLKSFSSDQTSGHHISVAEGQYASALSQIAATIGRPLDLIGFDACLMAMWEVAEASAPFGRLLVASEETEPSSGWDYDGFLPALLAKPTMPAAELAKQIADTYLWNGYTSSTMSAIDLSTIPALESAMTTFADALIDSLPTFRGQLALLQVGTGGFTGKGHVDLSDFANRVSTASTAPAALKQAALDLLAQLKVSVAYSRAQRDYSYAKGMAVYLTPSGSGLDPLYRGAGAVWSQNTSWDEFLEAF
jgi:hypothetical protein